MAKIQDLIKQELDTLGDAVFRRAVLDSDFEAALIHKNGYMCSFLQNLLFSENTPDETLKKIQKRIRTVEKDIAKINLQKGAV